MARTSSKSAFNLIKEEHRENISTERDCGQSLQASEHPGDLCLQPSSRLQNCHQISAVACIMRLPRETAQQPGFSVGIHCHSEIQLQEMHTPSTLTIHGLH